MGEEADLLAGELFPLRVSIFSICMERKVLPRLFHRNTVFVSSPWIRAVSLEFSLSFRMSDPVKLEHATFRYAVGVFSKNENIRCLGNPEFYYQMIGPYVPIVCM